MSTVSLAGSRRGAEPQNRASGLVVALERAGVWLNAAVARPPSAPATQAPTDRHRVVRARIPTIRRPQGIAMVRGGPPIVGLRQPPPCGSPSDNRSAAPRGQRMTALRSLVYRSLVMSVGLAVSPSPAGAEGVAGPLPHVLIGVGDSLTQGTMDGTDNA